MATNNEINITTPFSVSNGGTGQSTLTNHGILVGAGTSAITSLAVGADHSILIGATGADPAFTTSGTLYASGISFDAGSNTLSNFVTQNSWTPVLLFGGANVGMAFTSQVGVYFQIGKVLFCVYSITFTTKGSSTGVATISGFPFANAGSLTGTVMSGIGNITYGANVGIEIANGATAVGIFNYSSAAAPVQLTNTSFVAAGTKTLAGFIFYIVS